MSIPNKRIMMKLQYIESVLNDIQAAHLTANGYHSTQFEDETFSDDYGKYLDEVAKHLEIADKEFKKFN